jgi:hypothetical protein
VCVCGGVCGWGCLFVALVSSRDDLDSIHAQLASIARPAAVLSSDLTLDGNVDGELDPDDWETLADEHGEGMAEGGQQQGSLGSPRDAGPGYPRDHTSSDDHLELSLRDVAIEMPPSPMESGSNNNGLVDF